MSNPASDPTDAADPMRGAVVVGVVPGQSARVARQAAVYADLWRAPLVAVHVDVTRFVTYEDPDGFVTAAALDDDLPVGQAQLEQVRAELAAALGGTDVRWEVRQVIGDPAMAIRDVADALDAKVLVVGTRKRGIGESIREFLTGSVAARLAHRQRRPVLVIPVGDSLRDDQDPFD